VLAAGIVIINTTRGSGNVCSKEALFTEINFCCDEVHKNPTIGELC
jgi:hypothetical protein